MLEAARAHGHCAAKRKCPAQGESPLGKEYRSRGEGQLLPPRPPLLETRPGPKRHREPWLSVPALASETEQQGRRGSLSRGRSGALPQPGCRCTGASTGRAAAEPAGIRQGSPPGPSPQQAGHTSTVPHAAPLPDMTQAARGRRMGPAPCQVTVEQGPRAARCRGRPKRTPAFIYNTPQVTDNRNNKEQGQNSSTTQQRKGNAAPASPAPLPNPLVPGRAPQPPPRWLRAQAGKGLLPPLPWSVGGTGMCQLFLDRQCASAAAPRSEAMAQKPPEPHREGGPKKGPLG